MSFSELFKASTPVAPAHGGYPTNNGNSTGQVGGYAYTAGVGYGSITIPTNTINSAGSNSIGHTNFSKQLTIQAPGANVMIWGPLDQGELTITFLEHENHQLVRALFEPDSNMSPLESLRIQALITGIAAHAAAGQHYQDIKPLTYIRRYSLERHFRFSVT